MAKRLEARSAMTGAAPSGHPDPRVRRRFLVVLTTVVLWSVGYLAYTVSNAVQATGPEEPHVRERAGEDAGDE